MADSVFNPKDCSIPDVPPIEEMPVLVDCDIPIAPDPIVDCPNLDLPIPAILGWMGFECVGGEFGPPGPGGPPGPPGPPGPAGEVCIRVLTKSICVHKPDKVRVEVFTFMFQGCFYIRFIFYVYCPHDKELCCWWKYCPAYTTPGDPADALFECKHGEDGYTSPYVGNGGDSGDDCPWVLITKNAACEDCDNGPCSVELIGAYSGQVEIWCDCNEVASYDCSKCGACWLPNEIEAIIDIYYEYRVQRPDGTHCWVPIGSGSPSCQTVPLTRERPDEEDSNGCWVGSIEIDKFDDTPLTGDVTLDEEAEHGGEICDATEHEVSGALCPTLKLCCNANDENEKTPEMTVLLDEQPIELTGLTFGLPGCGETTPGDCELWSSDSIQNNNGWIRNCLIDCSGDAIPEADEDSCIEWCHGFDKDEKNNTPIIADVQICHADGETRKIRIHQFTIKINCQCCTAASETV